MICLYLPCNFIHSRCHNSKERTFRGHQQKKQCLATEILKENSAIFSLYNHTWQYRYRRTIFIAETIIVQTFCIILHTSYFITGKANQYAILRFSHSKKHVFQYQIRLFLKKNTKMFGGIKKTSYLCTRKKQKASFLDADKHCKT